MRHGASLRRVAAGCAAALLALCAAPRSALSQSAQAAPPGDAQHAEQLRTLYREGVEAATAGRWSEARDRFLQVLAMRSSPRVLFSLAQAEEQLGAVASAQADYGRALMGARAAAGQGEVVTASEQAIAAIGPRVPHVRVVVSGVEPARAGAGVEPAEAGAGAVAATATLDGQPIAVGAPVAVDPGAHRIVVSAPGMRDGATSVAIVERAQLDVPVRLEPVAPSPAAGSAPSAGPETAAAAAAAPGGTGAGAGGGGGAGPWRTVGLVVAGAGVVAVGVGFAVALDAKSGWNRASGEPGTARQTDSGSAVSEGNVASVVLGVGAAVAAAGVVLWLTAPVRPDGAPGLAVGIGGRQVTLQGRF